MHCLCCYVPEPVGGIIWMHKICSWFGAIPLYLLALINKKVLPFPLLFLYFWLMLADPQDFTWNKSFFLKLLWAYVMLFPKFINSSICLAIFIFKHHIIRYSGTVKGHLSLKALFSLSRRVLYPAISWAIYFNKPLMPKLIIWIWKFKLLSILFLLCL